MSISRYALGLVAVAVLSLLGLTQADTSVTRSAIPPRNSTTFSAPNGVHVQMMREASNAYPLNNEAGNGDVASCRQNATCQQEQRRREAARCTGRRTGEPHPHYQSCGNRQSNGNALPEK